MLFGLYVVFGRFLVKAAAKRKTEYILTNSRALVLKSGRVDCFLILKGCLIITDLSSDRRHGSVYFGYLDGRTRHTAALGLDFVNGGGSVGFFDVRDPEPLFEALSATPAGASPN